jgi:hypothetical protein
VIDGYFPRGQSDQDVKLTSHLRIVPRSRVSGTVRLFPLYAFLAWTARTLLIFTRSLLD